MDCLWWELCVLVCLCILLQSESTASQPENIYSQEPNSDIPQSRKLNSLDKMNSYGDYELKRGSAFFPLRGKKPETFLPEEYDSEDKRSQFFPLRGKKIPDELKRGSYFMPMRGRKDDAWTSEESDETSEGKRASSFMPMRGKKKSADYLSKSGTYESEVSYPLTNTQVDEKRASFFVPVRGKRSARSPDLEPHPIRKRSTFVSLQGRRDSKSSEGIATSLVDERKSQPEDNEVTSDGEDGSARFVPTGEQDEAGSSRHLLSKKSAFMPMRGRRSHEGLDGNDGKYFPKRRSSFTLMRGRKSDGDFTVEPWSPEQLVSLLDKKSSDRTADVEDENFTVEPWPAEQLMSLFDKKSFSPMHRLGDDDDDETFTVEPWPADQLMSLFSKRSGDGRSTLGSDRRVVATSSSFYNPYSYFMTGLGSSFISRPYSRVGSSFDGEGPKKQTINWDSVKRAFHATRGKREPEDGGAARTKRSLVLPRVAMHHNRQYIALKRPMSFFATRGKRTNAPATDASQRR